jgi:hypothetical protein
VSDAGIFSELSELLIDLPFDLLDFRLNSIVNFAINDVDAGLIESLVLVEDLLRLLLDHFHMLLNGLRVFKILCDQFLGEIA